jgi:hypothetical protein
MIIVGCDFHTRFQQVAMLDPTTGEVIERRLEHETGEARSFYASLSEPARVGIEATVNAQWFEKVLREYHHELWVGDAAGISVAKMIDRPASPGSRKGSSEKKSWSEVQDRIHGWWSQLNSPRDFKGASLGREWKRNPEEDEAPLRLQELWRAVRGVKGLAINARFADALDSAPDSQSSECLLTMPTTLYTGFSETGRILKIRLIGSWLQLICRYRTRTAWVGAGQNASVENRCFSTNSSCSDR